jgi:hypothetical protein
MGRARGTKRRRKGKKHGSKRQARKVQKANRAISKPRSLVVSPTALRTAEARGGALTVVRDVLAIDVQAGASRRGYAIMPSRHDKLLRQVVADFVQQHPCLQGMRLLNSWAKAAVVDAYTRQGLSRGWTPGPLQTSPSASPIQSSQASAPAASFPCHPASSPSPHSRPPHFTRRCAHTDTQPPTLPRPEPQKRPPPRHDTTERAAQGKGSDARHALHYHRRRLWADSSLQRHGAAAVQQQECDEARTKAREASRRHQAEEGGKKGRREYLPVPDKAQATKDAEVWGDRAHHNYCPRRPNEWLGSSRSRVRVAFSHRRSGCAPSAA